MIRNSPALMTDFYELTMAAGYFENHFARKATFELYCHTLPQQRSFLVACGLEEVVNYILNLRFSRQDIRYLKSHPAFSNVSELFFDYLKFFKFSGNVWAMPEGEICFANEPILQVEAPVIEAQILETYLLSMINIQTCVASKAVRVVSASRLDGRQRQVVDFGSRRAHGPAAGVLAARAAFVGGCMGTSNVYAGRKYGIPVLGTMAHSWVQAYEKEEIAFRKYQKVFPDHAIFLIDTYDTLNAAKKVVGLKKPVRGVRIDSGDLLGLSQKVRKVLDRNGLKDVKIIGSGNLDEYKIEELVHKQAPIDFFGVGTEMVVSGDAPSLDLTYKLVQIESPGGRVSYTAKLSRGKHTVPGRKQVYRHFNSKGMMVQDDIALASEPAIKDARPLLAPVMRQGRLLPSLPLTSEIRSFVLNKLEQVPRSCRLLKKKKDYPVKLSPRIKALLNAVRRRR